MFTVSGDTEITPLLMCDYIKIHNQRAAKLNVLYRYYTGDHDILKRIKKSSLANNKVVVNHANPFSFATSAVLSKRRRQHS